MSALSTPQNLKYLKDLFFKTSHITYLFFKIFQVRIMGGTSNTRIFEIGKREAGQYKWKHVDDRHSFEFKFDWELKIVLDCVPQFNYFWIFFLYMEVFFDLSFWNCLFRHRKKDIYLLMWTFSTYWIFRSMLISIFDDLFYSIDIAIFKEYEEFIKNSS